MVSLQSATSSRSPHDLAAVVHVHSTDCYGTATVPEIIEAAADAEADAVLLTDHDNLRAREGWHQGVLLLVGVEIGMELWSLITEAIDCPPARNLGEWDRRCMRDRVVAIGGVRAGGTALKALRDARSFRRLRTHVLCERAPTGELETDRQLVLAALREGRCYIGRDSLASTRGFRYYAEGPGGYLSMGDESTAGDWTLHVRAPLKARMRLIRDGREIHATTASSLDVLADGPGVYRVEVEFEALGKVRTWIVSNPICLRQ